MYDTISNAESDGKCLNVGVNSLMFMPRTMNVDMSLSYAVLGMNSAFDEVRRNTFSSKMGANTAFFESTCFD